VTWDTWDVRGKHFAFPQEMLRGETKDGKREEDDKRDRRLVNRLLVSMFARLCPAP